MNSKNQTTITDFVLLGFQDIQNFRSLLFLFVLLIYMVSVIGNLLIIILVPITQTLNSPMYFFLSHLSCCDILLTSLIAPLLMSLLSGDIKKISFIGCLAQFYLFGALATTECFLLSVMSYDRYIAICNPLRYASLMNFQRCFHLVFWCWLIAFSLMLNTALQVGKLYFCGPNVIDHFFCDLAPLLQLSCSNTSFVETENLVVGFPSTFLPLIFIIATYIYIFHTILKIPSTFGRQKAFYTCSSHLTVVSIYYGTLIVAYLFLTKKHSLNLNKALSFLYTVVTPSLNPIIYSLRSKDIKTALAKLMNVEAERTSKWKFWPFRL